MKQYNIFEITKKGESMISSKERAKLRAMAQKLEPVVLVGKGGINDSVLDSISLVLESKELVKIKLLQNSGLDSKSASEEICAKLLADGVQRIGSTIVVYRRSHKKDVYHILQNA